MDDRPAWLPTRERGSGSATPVHASPQTVRGRARRPARRGTSGSVEGFGLTAGTVEGGDQLQLGLFMERIGVDEPFQLANRLW